MISGAFNSLIWILVLIAVIAVVVAVVRAASRPGARQERVVQQPVVQQPIATSGLAPGWYPDQNDPNMTRYFDGRVWTAQTQPR
jgi:hypothetical protein